MNVLSLPADDDGVSPVIASILIVAMTVVLVGIISAVVVGMSGVPEAAPIVGLSIEKSGADILIHHQNGAVLPEGKYAVLINGVEVTTLPPGDFTPGLTFKFSGAGKTAGTVSVVYKGWDGLDDACAENL